MLAKPYYFSVYLYPLLCLLFLVTFPVHSAEPQRGLTIVSVPDQNGQKIDLYTASYAMVIGVSTYTAGWPNLPGVREDVRKVQEVLETQGFKVTAVTNPTKDQLEETFEKFINDYGGKPEHRLLVYFAGHGHTMRPQYGGNPLGYLVPTNAPNPHNDPNGFKRLALSMQRIEEYALTIEAKHVLFLFDSCFSGSIFALSRAIPENISYKTSQPVRQFITSGDENEQVPDKSIFREQFVAALQGEADTDKDGYVTGTELGEFLQARVVNYSKDAQHPQYGKIRHPKLDRGDFVFQTTSLQRHPVSPPRTTADNPAETERQRVSVERQRLEASRSRAEAPPVVAAVPPAAPSPADQPFFMTRLVTEDDLRSRNPWELEVMRNEIFARHGRRFKRQDLQRHFEQQPWYRGQYEADDFPFTLLTDIQQRNVVFMQKHKQFPRR